MTFNLFDDAELHAPADAAMGTQACVLRQFATPFMPLLVPALHDVLQAAPLRHLVTPGGHTMSVASTNCGTLGWITDRRGYRYVAHDPVSGAPWPALPAVFLALARDAAARAGFPDFVPDACLVNRYGVGARMSLHQDKDEADRQAPIVSVSLGMPAIFLFGGTQRAAPTARYPLFDGDVAVWGGVDRFRFHGVMPLKRQPHPVWGDYRINLTFRRAG